MFEKNCENCNDHQGCTCGKLLAGTQVNNLATSIVTTIPGPEGQQGNIQLLLYTKSISDTIIPTISQTVNPSGWSTKPPILNEGEFRWIVTGIVNFNNTILIENWSTPVVDINKSYKTITEYHNIPYTTSSIVNKDGSLFRAMSNILSNDIPNNSLKWQIFPKGAKIRNGRYITPDFGHRCGVFEYEIKGNKAKLITDLTPFKANTNLNFVGLTTYVDSTNGLASNNGLSWATAKARVDQALALNPDIIMVRYGPQQGSSQFANNLTITKDIAIIGVGGQVIAGTPQKGLYTKEPGYNFVYRRATEGQGTTQKVYDMVARDEYLAPKLYTLVTSISAVEAQEGSIYRESTGGILIHPYNNRLLFPNDNTIIMETIGNDMTITFTGNYKLYMENITFVGVNSWVLKSNGSQYPQSIFYNKNCKWLGMKRNGIGVTDIGICISEESEISYSLRDGFNYHWGLDFFGGQTIMSPHFVELDVLSTSNGYQRTDLNNQASTSHEDCIGFRLNGTYAGHKDGGNIVDVGGTKCYFVNPHSFGSSIVGMYLSSAAGGTDGRRAKWWIDGAIVEKNSTNPGPGNGDISVSGGFADLHLVDEYTDKPTFIFSNVITADRIL